MDMIAFTGLKGSGKDTAAAVFEQNGHAHLKFADGIKEMLRALMVYQGADPAEIERYLEGDLKGSPCPWLGNRTPRHAMQKLGTEWGRMMMGSDFWVSTVRHRIDYMSYDRVVISDVRFPNECDFVESHRGRVYRVDRGFENHDPHPSETEILNLPVADSLFNNADSAEAFQDRVRSYFGLPVRP